MNTAKAITTELIHCAQPEYAKLLARFFKTEQGAYGEGDRFLGIKVPVTRSIVKRYQNNATIDDASALLNSPWHECRIAGAILLIHQYRTGTEKDKHLVYQTYLKHPGLNNWDLIDISAPRIIGEHLQNRSIEPLRKLSRSSSLWKRRIAVVSTLQMVDRGNLLPTFELCERLMHDTHDLIHKACGWALREAGKHDAHALKTFLDQYATKMPRTMLRYAIEKFSETERKRYLRIGKAKR